VEQSWIERELDWSTGRTGHSALNHDTGTDCVTAVPTPFSPAAGAVEP
jgi:hypothetical protein